MIVRIVRMVFEADQVEAFEAIFAQYKHQIRSVPGCLHLELHRDVAVAHVRYTYSHWTDQEALDAYRDSQLFGEVWPKTKALFAEKPTAFSLAHQETVNLP